MVMLSTSERQHLVLLEKNKYTTKFNLLYRTAGAIILKIAYGYTIEPAGSDPFVELANRALEIFSESVIPGKWIVDIMPFRMFLFLHSLV